MPEKRRDSNGRNLKTGESQRANGTYMYRYTLPNGKKQWCYAPTLKELREKEKEVTLAVLERGDVEVPYTTVSELVDYYIKNHDTVKRCTADRFAWMSRQISRWSFGSRAVSDIKQADAKAFIAHLHTDGLGYGTIVTYHNILRPAFEIAVQDRCIRSNPFLFRTSTVVNMDAKAKYALTPEQVESFLTHVKLNRPKHYDEIVILLETGLRISELCGLTIGSVDLEARQIVVTQQLLEADNQELYIQTPKTSNGVRIIPLTDAAYEAFKRTLERRANQTCIIEVNGHSDFIFLSRANRPRTAEQMRDILKSTVKSYNQTHDTPLPNITPHILRHTFITRLYSKGLDIKCLQLIAGHANVRTTLDTYTHINSDKVVEEFRRVTQM